MLQFCAIFRTIQLFGSCIVFDPESTAVKLPKSILKPTPSISSLSSAVAIFENVQERSVTFDPDASLLMMSSPNSEKSGSNSGGNAANLDSDHDDHSPINTLKDVIKKGRPPKPIITVPMKDENEQQHEQQLWHQTIQDNVDAFASLYFPENSFEHKWIAALIKEVFFHKSLEQGYSQAKRETNLNKAAETAANWLEAMTSPPKLIKDFDQEFNKLYNAPHSFVASLFRYAYFNKFIIKAKTSRDDIRAANSSYDMLIMLPMDDLNATFEKNVQSIINVLPTSVPLWQTWYLLWFHDQELLEESNLHERIIEKLRILCVNSNKNNGQDGRDFLDQLLKALPPHLTNNYFKQDSHSHQLRFKTRKELQQQIVYAHYNPLRHCSSMFASSYRAVSQTLTLFAQNQDCPTFPDKK